MGASPSSLPTTESEEMYLIHVAMAAEDGIEGAVPLRTLAEMLSVTPISANQMVKKLVARGLAGYTPYQGVVLTEDGKRIAGRVLRVRRLWAVFLADRLGLSPAEADRVACDLEHVTPAEVVDRLAGLLGDPATAPSGQPIPAADGSEAPGPSVPLTELPVGGTGTVTAIDGSAAVESFLAASGAEPGSPVTVLAVVADNVLVELAGEQAHLSDAVAGAIRVRAAAP